MGKGFGETGEADGLTCWLPRLWIRGSRRRSDLSVGQHWNAREVNPSQQVNIGTPEKSILEAVISGDVKYAIAHINVPAYSGLGWQQRFDCVAKCVGTFARNPYGVR